MSANLYNNVVIGEREFAIRKFTAKTGLKMARTLLAKIAPAIPGLGDVIDAEAQAAGAEAGKTAKKAPKSGAEGEQQAYNAIGEALTALDDETLDYVINQCMQVCFELGENGENTPVMNPFGKYLVPDVEYDLGLTLRLCVEAIRWGAADFFGENRSDLIQSLKSIFS